MSWNAEFIPQSLMEYGFADLRFFKLAGAKLWGFSTMDRRSAIFELERRIYPAKPYGVWFCRLALFQISGCETLGFRMKDRTFAIFELQR